MKTIVILLAVLGLSACATPMQYMTRAEVIQAAAECESGGMQPRTVYARIPDTPVAGTVDVVCDVIRKPRP